MSKAFAPGRALLRRVADEYRANPGRWSPAGFGTLPDGSAMLRKNPTEIQLRGMTRICPDLMLMRYAPDYGPDALWQARTLLFRQIGGITPGLRQRIWFYNDVAERSLTQVIDTFEAAAHRRSINERLIDRLAKEWRKLQLRLGTRVPVPAFG